MCTILHGNSKDLKRPAHIYKIFEIETGKKHKIGESAGGVTRENKSIRAETQRRRLNKAAGRPLYDSEIIRTYDSKAPARKYETKLIKGTREKEGPTALPGNKTNR